VNKCNSLDPDSKQGLLNSLNQIPLVSNEALEKLFNKSVAIEINYDAQKALEDIIGTVADTLYEKYIGLLDNILETYNKRIQDEVKEKGQTKKPKTKKDSNLQNIGKEPVAPPSKETKPKLSNTSKKDDPPPIIIEEKLPKTTKEETINMDSVISNAPPLSSPTVNRPKIQAKRLPPTRRPVQNSRLSIMVKPETNLPST